MQVDINAIMREFDQYVQVSLKNKSSNGQEPQHTNNELDQYYHNMEKRLKIKTVTQDQKFQKMLGPMKKLKSFVSVKEFLRGLNQRPIKTQNEPVHMSQNTKRKLQYEDLRGGLYMQKVQNHLKRNHLKRKLDDQAEFLLRQLEEKQSQKNQYRTWMENVLGKINMKEECFLRPSQSVETEQTDKVSSKNFVFTDLTNTDHKKSKKENLKRRISEEQQQKNFKKVSNFLAQRLRKILTDKYVNNSSKQSKKNKQMMNEFQFDENYNTNLITQPSSTTMGLTCRKTICRTSATSKRMRQSVRMPQSRAQTTDVKHRKPSEDIWKKKFNTKMDDIMCVANTYYKKCQQEKKEYKSIVNPYCILVQDDFQK